MSIREIITDWVTPAGGALVSVMYFNEDGTSAADQREALGNLLDGIKGEIASVVSYRVRTDGRVLDETDGSLTALWNESTVYAAAGTSTSGPVPDAAQILLRWRTPTIVAGRVLQGRTFIPGGAAPSVDGGNVPGVVVTLINNEIDQFLAASVGFCIWSRPAPPDGVIPGRPGVAALVGSGSCWNEFAVLRGRRA